MNIHYFGQKDSDSLLIQPVDEYDLSNIENEIKYIKELTDDKSFYLAAIKTDNWNSDLSPWPAPPVFGKEGFGGNANATLEFILDLISDYTDRKIYIGGYSLSGLFSLWASYTKDVFEGCAACSPSVWFPNFKDFACNEKIQTKKVYLSLGDKESKTRNPVMSQVGECITEICESLISKNVDVTMEWNVGNHFKEPDLRTAKGFAKLLND